MLREVNKLNHYLRMKGENQSAMNVGAHEPDEDSNQPKIDLNQQTLQTPVR